MSEYSSRQEDTPQPDDILRMGQELLRHYGIDDDPFIDPDGYRQTLRRLDPRYREGRANLTRQQLEHVHYSWTLADMNVITLIADRMGMLRDKTAMPNQDSEITIAIGGARQSNFDRANYAANGLSEGSLLVVAGSSRRLAEGEPENVANYAPGVCQDSTEYDLCKAAAELVQAGHPGLTIESAHVGSAGAETPDVIEGVLLYFAEGKGRAPTSITVVTNQIYTLYTLMDLRRIAELYGITNIHVAGCPSDPKVVAARTLATYLSEILRTLRAALGAYLAS